MPEPFQPSPSHGHRYRFQPLLHASPTLVFFLHYSQDVKFLVIIDSIRVLADNGDLDAEMTHRIQSGWKNWKRISGILCDRRISLRVKGNVYKTVVRPAMMYGAETWAVKKAHEKKLDVAEMRMLRWMSGFTKMDRIRNERIIRGTTKVGEISKKVQESRLKWYGHVSRREDEYVGKRVMGMEVPGKRRRGRPKRRWLDSIRNDLSERGLSEEDAQDRPRWRRLIRHIDLT